jgi:phage tail sheath protein FI
MCAARGDLFAVLSMPEHHREDDAQSYVMTLKSSTAAAIEVKSRFKVAFEGAVETRQIIAISMPLSAGEAGDFSYAAVYHPWLIGAEERDRFSGNPPDGVACGVIAARALTRGAWIAPANEALRGPVALTPAIKSERWLDLQQAQINIIRQDARGFMSMSADTLSDDDDLRPINVRRLLSLLRRLALRLGATYVFEPNDFSFRRLVQRGFEAMLGEMFVRGAFAGTTPQTSFQVVTGDSLNTRQSIEQGRFIVELRVAPSLPMTFMTIRLVQTGDRTSVLETR